MNNAQFMKLADSVLQAQSFSRYLGTALHTADVEQGTAELSLTIDPDKHGQQNGFVHGGVLSYLADNSLTFAAGTISPDVLTAEFKINYLKPATGQQLIARAKVISVGKSQVVCESRIYAVQQAQEKLAAIAIGTIAIRPSENERKGT